MKEETYFIEGVGLACEGASLGASGDGYAISGGGSACVTSVLLS